MCAAQKVDRGCRWSDGNDCGLRQRSAIRSSIDLLRTFPPRNKRPRFGNGSRCRRFVETLSQGGVRGSRLKTHL